MKRVIIDNEGTVKWFLNNELHRKGGPAIDCLNGSKFWYLNGLLHREDGPAMEFSTGNKAWWLNGIKYTEGQYKKMMRSKKLKEIL